LSYWVALVARNATEHIRSTLESLFQQTLKPTQVIIVNDGSTDETQSIVLGYADRYPKTVRIVTLPDRGYDIRRVPSNINLAWSIADASDVDTAYFMISGDDCTYSRHYAATLASRMRSETKLVVASGRPSAGGIPHEQSPAGSGRFVRCSFWREIGGRYPLKAGWETWLLYKAMERGCSVALLPEATFHHVRPRGAKHQFAYWGAAMHSLGYQPLYAMGRIAKNVVNGSIPVRGSVNMLRGYLVAGLGSSDPFISPFQQSLREFVYRDQAQRIRDLTAS
jgi:hypothetical protein